MTEELSDIRLAVSCSVVAIVLVIILLAIVLLCSAPGRCKRLRCRDYDESRSSNSELWEGRLNYARTPLSIPAFPRFTSAIFNTYSPQALKGFTFSHPITAFEQKQKDLTSSTESTQKASRAVRKSGDIRMEQIRLSSERSKPSGLVDIRQRDASTSTDIKFSENIITVIIPGKGPHVFCNQVRGGERETNMCDEVILGPMTSHDVRVGSITSQHAQLAGITSKGIGGDTRVHNENFNTLKFRDENSSQVKSSCSSKSLISNLPIVTLPTTVNAFTTQSPNVDSDVESPTVNSSAVNFSTVSLVTDNFETVNSPISSPSASVNSPTVNSFHPNFKVTSPPISVSPLNDFTAKLPTVNSPTVNSPILNSAVNSPINLSIDSSTLNLKYTPHSTATGNELLALGLTAVSLKPAIQGPEIRSCPSDISSSALNIDDKSTNDTSFMHDSLVVSTNNNAFMINSCIINDSQRISTRIIPASNVNTTTDAATMHKYSMIGPNSTAENSRNTNNYNNDNKHSSNSNFYYRDNSNSQDDFLLFRKQSVRDAERLTNIRKKLLAVDIHESPFLSQPHLSTKNNCVSATDNDPFKIVESTALQSPLIEIKNSPCGNDFSVTKVAVNNTNPGTTVHNSSEIEKHLCRQAVSFDAHFSTESVEHDSFIQSKYPSVIATHQASFNDSTGCSCIGSEINLMSGARESSSFQVTINESQSVGCVSQLSALDNYSSSFDHPDEINFVKTTSIMCDTQSPEKSSTCDANIQQSFISNLPEVQEKEPSSQWSKKKNPTMKRFRNLGKFCSVGAQNARNVVDQMGIFKQKMLEIENNAETTDWYDKVPFEDVSGDNYLKRNLERNGNEMKAPGDNNLLHGFHVLAIPPVSAEGRSMDVEDENGSQCELLPPPDGFESMEQRIETKSGTGRGHLIGEAFRFLDDFDERYRTFTSESVHSCQVNPLEN